MTSNTLKFFVFITVVFFSLFANAEGVKLKENTFTVNTTLSLILDATLKGNCQDWDAATKITIYDANGDVYDKLDLIDVKNDTVNEILEEGTYFLRIEDHNVRSLRKVSVTCDACVIL